MIRHLSSRREDRVFDSMGCLRLFGGVFVVTGVWALSVALFGLAGLGSESLGIRCFVGLIGAAHLGGGLATGWGRTVHARVTRAGVERTERRPLRASVHRRLAPHEVAGVEVETETDSDGDEFYRVLLVLTSGERVGLTRHTTPMRKTAEAIATSVARRLNVAASIAAPEDAASPAEAGGAYRPSPSFS